MSLADGCRYVFLDAGANIGIHERFLFEPALYPLNAYDEATWQHTFPADRRRKDVCAFGFEPNPLHWSKLQRLQAAYSSQGWRTRFFRAAVAAKSGNMTFWHVNEQSDRENNEWEFSSAGKDRVTRAQRLRSNATQETVAAVDLAAWVNEHVRQRRVPAALLPSDPPPAVVMKMDVEGSEYEVLTSMLFKGALCNVSIVTVEWHPHLCHHAPLCTPNQLPEVLSTARHVPGCEPLTLLDVDDESYRNDETPLPSAAAGKGAGKGRFGRFRRFVRR